MSLPGRFSIKSIVLFISFISSSLFSSGWFPIYENGTWPKINAVAKGDNGLNTLFVVGDNGSYFYSDQGGFDWQTLNTGTTENLLAIASARDWMNSGTVHHVAVGENGTVLHYDEVQDQWNTISGLGSNHFNAVYYDDNTASFWIGGENGQLYVSVDYGATWLPKPLELDHQVLGIHATYDAILLFTQKNDTTFILRENAVSGFFISHSGDTLVDIKMVQAVVPEGEYTGTMYLLGLEQGVPNTHIYEIPRSGQASISEVYVGDLGIVTGMGASGSNDLMFWITTEGGALWESFQTLTDWDLIYSDQEGRDLGPIICTDWSEDPGRVFGAGGIILKYGFELLFFRPEANRNLSANFNQLELEFSLIPDLTSIERYVWVNSDQRGTIPFSAEYDPGDSTRILLDLQSDFGPAQIPGEKLNVTLGDSLIALMAKRYFNFREINYELNIVSNRPSSFQFNEFYQSTPIGRPTTNWVNGFINQDDVLDFVTFADDTLYCFMGSIDGNFDQVTKLYFPGLISLRVPPNEQLILYDLDQDGLPDLLLYDQSQIFILQNESTGSDILFTGPTVQQSEEVINKLVLYNDDSDGFVDLMILGTRFGTLMDIHIDDFGLLFNAHDFGTISHLFVDLADLNGDGYQDMMLIDNDGQLVLREGTGSGYFNDFNQVMPASGRSYTAVKAVNLNDDNHLEIIAYNSTYTDLIVFGGETHWGFNLERQNIISTVPDILLDLYIQDFGGQRDQEFIMRPDIIALTSDSLLFFENETYDISNIQFTKLETYSKYREIPFDKLLAGDYDQEGTIDFAAYDVTAGQFNIWNKFTWQPQIDQFDIGRYQVSLDWTPFPDEVGTLDYYNVYRSDQPEFDHQAYIRQTASNHFVDYEMGPYETFWYAVQAVYNGGIESDWSPLDSVKTFIELNGPQSGILEDTTRAYLAKTSISVEAGNSLEIQGGIRIGFEQDTRFDVFGNLTVSGNSLENQMVDFENAHWDSSGWEGIYLHPAADTVRFEWFSIMGARTGLQADNRPLKMHFGGIIGNQVGLLADSDSLHLENVVFDSNGVALRVQGSTHANVKNVTIYHSQVNSIVTTDASMTMVRNAIIWDNHGPVVKEQAGTLLHVKYSTVDSIGQNVSSSHISRLQPTFMTSDSGFYRPNIMSPTIDAGDPDDVFSDEPQPNGGRINQGLYGGSELATPSIQPRIAIEPGKLYLIVRPGYSDTSSFWIKNPGGSALNIMGISQSSESGAFQIVDNSIPSLAPNDSMHLRIVFNPQETIDYLDTLQILCNDPHLPNGIKSVPLFGRGSDVVPVVRLDKLADATFKESAVRFWYTVADSGSESVNPSIPGTYSIHYALVKIPGDTIETGFRLTQIPIDFYPLDDGLYKFIIWANPEPGNEVAENNTKTQYFTINVKTRTSLPLRWYMVSLPRNYSVDWKWFEQGDSSAYLLKWDNQEDDYSALNKEQIEPGQAFWAFPFKSLELNLALTDIANPLDINGVTPPFYLVPGWNQIGIPRDFSLYWNEMHIIPESGVNTEISFSDAVEAQIIDGAVYQFIQNSDYTGYDWNVVDSTTKAEPWVGYWLRANESCSIIFPETPAFNPLPITAISEPLSSLQKNVADGNWQLNLSLENAHYSDQKNILGIGATKSVPVAEPPHIGDYCALMIPSEKGNLTQQIYPEFSKKDEVKVWDMKVVTRNNSEEHTFSWNPDDVVESDFYLYLVDMQSEEVMDMRTQDTYSFNPKGNTSLFKVFASQDENFRPEIVPLSFKLEQNYPNPFNPQTTIRFGIPADADGKKISLIVYDILGQKTAVIHKGILNSGYHQFVWNGRNLKGKKTASGVYFYRLETAGKQMVKKMVLVR